MEATHELGFISGDSHVNEPRELWHDNLPARFREQAMRGIQAGEDGNWTLLIEGHHIDKTTEYEAERMLVSDPDHRLAIMGEEGVVGECIYPTIGLYVWMLTDPAGGAASCRVYNEWIADTLARSPRFKCAGLVPHWSVDDALAEVDYIVDAGLGAFMLPAVATPDWNHRTWAPLWAAIAESGLPAVVHQGTGHSMYWYRGPGAGVANLLATQTMAPRMAALLATSGVLAANPDLHVVFVEYNVGWLGWTMQTVDYYQQSFTDMDRANGGKPWVNPLLDEPPSHYMRRQIHGTFQDDPVAIHNIGQTGAEALIWGSDYPHFEGTYPHSRATIDRLSATLTPDQAARVFRQNAVELFHFEPAELTLL